MVINLMMYNEESPKVQFVNKADFKLEYCGQLMRWKLKEPEGIVEKKIL